MSTDSSRWSGSPGSTTSRSSTSEPRAQIVERSRARPRHARAIPPFSATRSATRSPPRSSAGTAPRRSSASSSGSSRPSRTSTRRARHLRQLPVDRVPPAAVPRSRLLQRLPRADEPLQAYLARLHNIAGDRPLLVTEIGLDSRSHGGDVQARGSSSSCARSTPPAAPARLSSPGPTSGTAAGVDIEDWHFGLVDRERQPEAGARRRAPRVRRGAASRRDPAARASRSSSAPTTASQRSDGASRRSAALDYPDYEVIVVDDGSTDRTAAIAARVRRPADQHGEPRPLRRAEHRHRGRARARSSPSPTTTPGRTATGSATWRTPSRPATTPGIGGPNLPSRATRASSRARWRTRPGGPIHVLLSDEIAEHIPAATWPSAARR